MRRLEGVLETALYVDDLQRSTRFYQSLFGFDIIASGERLVALGVPGPQVLLLFKKGGSAGLPVSAHDGDGHLHLAFAIPAADLAEWEDWLGQKNVPIEEKREWELGGSSLYFRDPDQHLIELTTPGTWSNY